MKRIITLSTLLFIAVFISTGCGRAKPKSPPIANLTNQTVTMKARVPYQNNVFIKNAIKTDCTLQTQLAQYTKKYAKGQKVNVTLSNNASKSNSHYYLDLVITNAVSEGNAFIGHRKMTQVQGTLYKDGAKLASFNGQRLSSGGFGGGFKSSCSVLGRTVDALGKDIAGWLKSPRRNSSLGD